MSMIYLFVWGEDTLSAVLYKLVLCLYCQVSDILDGKDEAVTKAIQEGINKANTKSESNAKRIAKFAILPTDFSVAGGELG